MGSSSDCLRKDRSRVPNPRAWGSSRRPSEPLIPWDCKMTMLPVLPESTVLSRSTRRGRNADRRWKGSGRLPLLREAFLPQGYGPLYYLGLKPEF